MMPIPRHPKMERQGPDKASEGGNMQHVTSGTRASVSPQVGTRVWEISFSTAPVQCELKRW